MNLDTDITPFARIILLGTETIYPGWYVRYYVEGRLLTERLELGNEADAFPHDTKLRPSICHA